MTAAVNQASQAAPATFAPAGHHARQGDNSNGFDDALASARYNAGHDGAAATDPHHWRQRGASDGTASPHEAKPAGGRGSHGKGNAAHLDALDPAQAADADADSAAAGDTVDTGVSAQVRAEQAISAMMALSPVGRQAGDADGPHADAGKDGREVRSGAAASHLASAEQALDRHVGDTRGPRPDAGPGTDGKASARMLPDDGSDPAMSAETLAAIRAKTPKAKPAEVATGRPAEKPADAAAQALEAGVTSLRKAAAGGAGADRGQSNAGSFGSRYAAQDGRRSDPSAAVKVSVVAQQAAPAPPAPTLSANAAAIISAAEQGWRAAAESPAQSALVLKGAQAMRSLKIQLHPAELGVVTASLKATGEHLSVELRVDNREAYHRLSADSDAIVKSLRALGYDIDRVSIHQPQAVSATAARPDAGSGTASFSRDASSFQPGNSGGNGERFGGQTDGRGYGDGTQRNDHAQPINQDRAGGGLYI